MREIIKEKVKKIISYPIFYSGTLKLYKSIFPNRNPMILMYHKIQKNRFEKQMHYLKKHYNVISLGELTSILKNKKSIKKNTIAITFDDGYLNNYLYAYPVLKKLNLNATIFITYDFIEKNTFTWWDRLESSKKNIDLNKLKSLNNNEIEEKVVKITGLNKGDKKSIQYSFMDWNKIKEITDTFEIGSHTLTHPILTNVSLKEADKEISECKKNIEKKIGQKTISFAYPNGNHDKNLINLVKKAGYECAVITKKGKIDKDTNLLRLYRRPINIKDNLAVFANKIAGVF